MLQPNVTVALTTHTDQPTLVLLTNDTKNLLTQYHWPLADVEKMGYMGTCVMVGDVALRMLAAAHDNIFARYPLLGPPQVRSNPISLITDLVMLQPNVTVALATNTEQPTLVILTNDTKNLLTQTHWSLADVEKMGYMGACEMVCNTALRMLAAAHPSIFAAHPLLVPPPPDDDPIAIITRLILLSGDARSSACVPAIDLLFKHHAAELAQTNMPEGWPVIRNAILRYPNDD